jgi:L-2-hydroxyglutarate oxidase LhgO
VPRPQAVVVGAGVVGLATAAALARAGCDVYVLETSSGIGQGVSSRNSEVIHAGFYYPQGSLKAALCVAGRRKLYDFCEKRHIPHKACGKLVVATSPREDEKLGALLHAGLANGVEGLRLLSPADAFRLEPQVRCTSALLSETTGIVDSHALMVSLCGEIEDHGGRVVLNTPFQGAERQGSGWRVRTGGADPFTFDADILVEAAGLEAQAVALRIEGVPPNAVPNRVLAKGSYFSLAGPSPFFRLIYPTPVDGGLGMHATLDLAGRVRFGPEVEWTETLSYEVDPKRAAAFERAIRTYWPGLPDDSLTPDYAGFRPKIVGPGASPDFRIDLPGDHGVSGLALLFGIESPGLTASLAIAGHVAQGLLS